MGFNWVDAFLGCDHEPNAQGRAYDRHSDLHNFCISNEVDYHRPHQEQHEGSKGPRVQATLKLITSLKTMLDLDTREVCL